MKLLIAILLTASFSTIALAKDFKGDRLSDDVRDSIRAEFKAKKEAIKNLPAEEQKEAMKALRTERVERKTAALKELGLSDEDIQKRMEKRKDRKGKKGKRGKNK